MEALACPIKTHKYERLVRHVLFAAALFYVSPLSLITIYNKPSNMQTFLTINPTLPIATSAIIISVASLVFSVRFARRNLRMGLQQAIFKIVQDKANDCNLVWKNEPALEMNNQSPHFLVMTELVISKEVIGKSFELFSSSWSSIQEMREDYYYLLYKQLTPDLRGYIHRSPAIAQALGNIYFSDQVNAIMEIFKKHFEPVK